MRSITAKAKAALKETRAKKHFKKTARKQNSKPKSNSKPSKKRSFKRANNEKDRPIKKRHTDPFTEIDYDLSLGEQKTRSVIKLKSMPTGLEEEQLLIFL